MELDWAVVIAHKIDVATVYDDGYTNRGEMMRQVARAIREERERCAEIAAEHDPYLSCGCGSQIAKRTREAK
jgi:hypothetical protein